jgi:agmatinase
MRLPTFPYLASTTGPGFLNARSVNDEARFVVAGIAWDGATTNRSGARHGPYAIRRASQMMCDACHPHWDVSPQPWIADIGDLPLPNTSLVGMRDTLARLAAPLIAAHHMVWLGGDHSVTLPLLQAYRAHHGHPLAVLHFDAHCDTWADHFGEPSGHGTWLYEAVEAGIVDPARVVQIGIRSPAQRDTREYIADRGGLVLPARALRGLDSAEQLEPLIAKVRRRLSGSAPLYMSFDIDALDPSHAPGTGTPEPAGLTSRQVATLLEELVDLPFIGMDLVEVSPPYDHADMTSQMAAMVVWTYLAGRTAQALR